MFSYFKSNITTVGDDLFASERAHERPAEFTALDVGRRGVRLAAACVYEIDMSRVAEKRPPLIIKREMRLCFNLWFITRFGLLTF